MRIATTTFITDLNYMVVIYVDRLKKQQLKQTTKNVSKFLKNITKYYFRCLGITQIGMGTILCLLIVCTFHRL